MASLNEPHDTEETPNKTAMILAMVVIALLVGGIGLFVLESGLLNPAPQATHSLPRGSR